MYGVKDLRTPIGVYIIPGGHCMMLKILGRRLVYILYRVFIV